MRKKVRQPTVNPEELLRRAVRAMDILAETATILEARTVWHKFQAWLAARGHCFTIGQAHAESLRQRQED